jgi:SAM-dependent methyltransferase
MRGARGAQMLPAMSSITISPTDLKRTHRVTWAAGDYGAIAELVDEVPSRDVLSRVPVTARDRVLDVATGTGNLALRAAAAGADVVGLDLTPELLETARRRAAAQDLSVRWVEGDAEELPCDDGAFDAVYSVFGVQFAPRHEVVAGQLARVTRPGGRIGLVNWTPSSFIGELFKVLGAYLPAPPSFASPPPRWGDEEHVRALFAGTGVELSFARGFNPFRFDSADRWVEHFETLYGPTLKARERLSAEGRWDECRREIVAMAERRNEATDGRFVVYSEYLVTIGRKAG